MKKSQKGIQFTITIMINDNDFGRPQYCNLHRMRLHTKKTKKAQSRITVKKDILQVDAAAAARCTGFWGRNKRDRRGEMKRGSTRTHRQGAVHPPSATHATIRQYRTHPPIMVRPRAQTRSSHAHACMSSHLVCLLEKWCDLSAQGAEGRAASSLFLLS